MAIVVEGRRTHGYCADSMFFIRWDKKIDIIPHALHMTCILAYLDSNVCVAFFVDEVRRG